AHLAEILCDGGGDHRLIQTAVEFDVVGKRQRAQTTAVALANARSRTGAHQRIAVAAGSTTGTFASADTTEPRDPRVSNGCALHALAETHEHFTAAAFVTFDPGTGTDVLHVRRNSA